LIDSNDQSWKTKPTDRFILRWIKLNLSARITPKIAGRGFVKPWMITVLAMLTGVCSGFVYARGCGLIAGLLALVSQTLDGVDGQLARMTGRQSSAGAFLDSALDRYADGALVIGLILYSIRMNPETCLELILFVGSLAIIGSGLISYTSSRAENLKLEMGAPTLASKGTRTSITIVCALLSPISSLIPFAGLIYLAVHTNAVVIWRLAKTVHDKP
jgi:phosphatidylglycerophosphate synthase